MKSTLAVSLPIAALGLLLAFIPGRILPVCAVARGAAPMKCHWTGMVLSGFGVSFFLVGALLFFFRDAGVRRGISVAAVLMAVLAGTVPTYLIGMCGSPAMPCRIGTYPAALIALALIALAGLANVFVLKDKVAQERRGNETAYDVSYSTEQP